MKNKMLALLGLAMRARKLVLGEDAVLDQCRHFPHHLIFLASDAGENITKKILDKASTYELTVVRDLSTTEISQAIGKSGRTVALVTEQGFVNTFQTYMNN